MAHDDNMNLPEADVQPRPEWADEWCKKWDETVSKLRKQFGLPPLKEENNDVPKI